MARRVPGAIRVGGDNSTGQAYAFNMEDGIGRGPNLRVP